VASIHDHCSGMDTWSLAWSWFSSLASQLCGLLVLYGHWSFILGCGKYETCWPNNLNFYLLSLKMKYTICHSLQVVLLLLMVGT